MARQIAIIGAGPGGYAAALRAARMGADVTIIEKDEVGGTCLNRGCIPSKVFKTTAHLMVQMGQADTFGVLSDRQPRLDMERLMERKQSVIQVQIGGMRSELKRRNVRFLEGRAQIRKPHELAVIHGDDRKTLVQWDRLIIATGSHPLEIPAFPFDGQYILSSTDLLGLRHLPASLLIVGGGVVGCEFASIFSAFGTKVTVVEALSRLLPLPSVDEDCSKILQREFKKRKIDFFLNHTVQQIDVEQDMIRASIGPSPLSTGGKQPKTGPKILQAEKALICIGRSPGIVGMDLDILGVETDEKGWIRASSRLKTSAPDIWAIGDALGPARPMLAHVASTEGIIAAENAMGQDRKMRYTVVPAAIFTMPEVATVGLTQTQASALGVDVRSDTVLFRTIGKAHVTGEIAGQMKMVSDKQSGKILGVHIIGPKATELIAEATLAVNQECTVTDLAQTIHAHPTLSEISMEVAFRSLEML